MANAYGAARLRARLAAGLSASVAQSPHKAFPFTDRDWALERRLREAVDYFTFITHYRVTIVPSDGCARRFYLCGTLDSVTRRASQIFGNASTSVVVEAAPIQRGGELLDKRLSILPLESTNHV